MPSRDRLRVVVAGAGRATQEIHLPTLMAHRELFEVVGVADPVAAVRAEIARRFGLGDVIHPGIEHLMLLEADALICATPIALHAGVVGAALEAGLHVLCEKPLALTRADYIEIGALSERAGRIVQVGYNKRFDPSFQTLLDLLPGDRSDILLIAVDVTDAMHRPFVTNHPPRSSDVDDEVHRLEAEQLESELGTGLPAAAYWAFRHGYLSSLVHDVNLVHGVLRVVDHPFPTTVTSGAFWSDGRAVAMTWDLDGDARAEARHVAVPGVASYQELLRIVCKDRILDLTYSSPFLLRHPARLVERRSAGDAGLRTTIHHTSFEDSFERQLLAFRESIVEGRPVENAVDAALLDFDALRAAHRHACGSVASVNGSESPAAERPRGGSRGR
jgi:predicted dehydrogenase